MHNIKWRPSYLVVALEQILAMAGRCQGHKESRYTRTLRYDMPATCPGLSREQSRIEAITAVAVECTRERAPYSFRCFSKCSQTPESKNRFFHHSPCYD